MKVLRGAQADGRMSVKRSDPTGNTRLSQPAYCLAEELIPTGILTDWHPSWKSELVSRSLILRSGMFIDVGANRGQTLMDYLAAEQTLSYIGFEPNCHCVSLLSDIIALHQRTDCLVIPVGLSDENTIRKLFLERGSKMDSSASIDADLRPGREWDVQFVPCYRLDDISSEIGMQKTGLVKIDVEGAEFAVLRGMETILKRDRPWVLCEVLHRDSKVGAPEHQQRIDSLMMWIVGMDYICFNVEKTSEDRHLRGLVLTGAFPNKVWTWDNRMECDYMFVPASDADLIKRLIEE